MALSSLCVDIMADDPQSERRERGNRDEFVEEPAGLVYRKSEDFPVVSAPASLSLFPRHKEGRTRPEWRDRGPASWPKGLYLLNEVMLERITSQFGVVLQLHLVQDPGAIGADRRHAQVQ